MRTVLAFILFVVFAGSASLGADEASYGPERKIYALTPELMDVVIPCTYKDLETLHLCIKGIKSNIANVRRIIVVSPEQLTEEAEWFPEAHYPFSKYDVMYEIFKDQAAADHYLKTPGNRSGWIYQQLLKLYAPFVIPDISSNVLIVDSDVVFLNQTTFLNEEGGGLYNYGWEYTPTYFDHMKRLIPWLEKVYPAYSGITDHMLFQRSILIDLFETVQFYHGEEMWKVFCRSIDHGALFAGASEYEIYFNFAFAKTNQVQIRKLQWTVSKKLRRIPLYKQKGYHYVTFHAWLRGK